MSPKPQSAEAVKDPPSGLLAKLNSQKVALALLVGLVGVGWFARGWVGELFAAKADAAQTRSLEEKVDSIETQQLPAIKFEQMLMKQDIEHVHEEIRGTREDFRALFPGRLPELPAEPAASATAASAAPTPTNR